MDQDKKPIKYRGRTITPHGSKFKIFTGNRLSVNSLSEAKIALDKYIENQQCLEKVKANIERITVIDGFLKFKAEKNANGVSKSTLRGYDQTEHQFYKDLPSIKYVDEITVDVWSSWSANGLGRWKQQSKWTLFVTLRGFVRWCNNKGYHVNSGFVNHTINNGKGLVVGKRQATQEEVQKLLEWARAKSTEIYVPILLSASLGIRPAEISRLVKYDYDEKTKILTIPGASTKTKRKRKVPVTQELHDLFCKCKAENSGEFLLRNKKYPNWTTEGLQSIIKRARAELDLPVDLGLYSLRKYACNVVANSTDDFRQVVGMMGHSPQVYDAYYEANATGMKDIARKIEDAIAGKIESAAFGFYNGENWLKFPSLEELIGWHRTFGRGRSGSAPGNMDNETPGDDSAPLVPSI
jgi:integrase